MSEESPAALLRRAAKHVRKLGAAATPGPWSRAMKTRTKSAIVAPTPDDVEPWEAGRRDVGVCSAPHLSAGMEFVRKRSGRDLDWIALMGPQVATALDNVLDVAADRAGTDDSLVIDCVLSLAKALLGEVPAQPDPDGAA